ncbi:hypothetical protein [Methylomagnum sp.]
MTVKPRKSRIIDEMHETAAGLYQARAIALYEFIPLAFGRGWGEGVKKGTSSLKKASVARMKPCGIRDHGGTHHPGLRCAPSGPLANCHGRARMVFKSNKDKEINRLSRYSAGFPTLSPIDIQGRGD